MNLELDRTIRYKDEIQSTVIGTKSAAITLRAGQQSSERNSSRTF